jgi:quinol monooxygenase YgiN
MTFIQIIEFKTKDIDAFTKLVDEFLEQTAGTRTATRGTTTRDRDAADTYLQIVEFPSYEAAMENSNDPKTAAFAERLQKVCDGPPSFRNLDVVRQEEM